MKKIPLTQGFEAIVDDEDYESLSRFKWYALKFRKYIYATRNPRSGRIYMHRVIMGEPSLLEVDHINGDGLNNLRSNLRYATRSENQRNRGVPENNTTGYKGVHRLKNRWVARIYVNGQRLHLGNFQNLEDAGRAYDSAAKRYFGEFARINLY